MNVSTPGYRLVRALWRVAHAGSRVLEFASDGLSAAARYPQPPEPPTAKTAAGALAVAVGRDMAELRRRLDVLEAPPPTPVPPPEPAPRCASCGELGGGSISGGHVRLPWCDREECRVRIYRAIDALMATPKASAENQVLTDRVRQLEAVIAQVKAVTAPVQLPLFGPPPMVQTTIPTAPSTGFRRPPEPIAPAIEWGVPGAAPPIPPVVMASPPIQHHVVRSTVDASEPVPVDPYPEDGDLEVSEEDLRTATGARLDVLGGHLHCARWSLESDNSYRWRLANARPWLRRWGLAELLADVARVAAQQPHRMTSVAIVCRETHTGSRIAMLAEPILATMEVLETVTELAEGWVEAADDETRLACGTEVLAIVRAARATAQDGAQPDSTATIAPKSSEPLAT